MHGLGLSRWLRWAFLASYIGAIAVVYDGFRGWENLIEVPRVPSVEYMLVFLIGGMVWLGLWLGARFFGLDRERGHLKA